MSNLDDSKFYGNIRELSITFMKTPKAESIVLKVEFIQHGACSCLHGVMRESNEHGSLITGRVREN